jgi:hypothetical protein
MMEEHMLTIEKNADTNHRRCGAILTLSFVLLAWAGGSAAAAQEPEPSPDDSAPIVAEEPTFDLGTLVTGDRVSHNFVIRNPGAEPVTIDRVLAACGCTVVEFDETIPPGGQGTIHAELDSSTLAGKGTSSIEVYVPGRERPAVTLVLEYEIVSKLLADPGYARWIYVQHEEAGTIAQTIYSRDGAEFEVVGVEPPMPSIDVTFREAEGDELQDDVEGSQWRVAATLDQEAPVGPITGFVKVHTTHPEQETIRIPVSGFVRPTLFVTPEHGDFGTLELSEPKRASYRIRNFATDPILITSVETDVPGISAKLEPIEEGRRYDIVLEFDPAKMEEGPFSGRLRVTTDSDAVPEVTVDLTGKLVRKAAETSG